jgi:hypothetical protein
MRILIAGPPVHVDASVLLLGFDGWLSSRLVLLVPVPLLDMRAISHRSINRCNQYLSYSCQSRFSGYFRYSSQYRQKRQGLTSVKATIVPCLGSRRENALVVGQPL